VRVGIREAKSRLSELIEAALAGVDVVITRHGKPLIRLVPEGQSRDKRKGRGCLKDIVLPAGWDSTLLDEEIAAQFEDLSPRSGQNSR